MPDFGILRKIISRNDEKVESVVVLIPDDDYGKNIRFEAHFDPGKRVVPWVRNGDGLRTYPGEQKMGCRVDVRHNDDTGTTEYHFTNLRDGKIPKKVQQAMDLESEPEGGKRRKRIRSALLVVLKKWNGNYHPVSINGTKSSAFKRVDSEQKLTIATLGLWEKPTYSTILRFSLAFLIAGSKSVSEETMIIRSHKFSYAATSISTAICTSTPFS